MAFDNQPAVTHLDGVDSMEMISLLRSDLPLEEWRQVANCKGMPVEMFYNDAGETPKAVRKVCEECRVSRECLAEALKVGVEDDFGYRGGYSRRQRKLLRRDLKKLYGYRTTAISWNEELQKFEKA